MTDRSVSLWKGNDVGAWGCALADMVTCGVWHGICRPRATAYLFTRLIGAERLTALPNSQIKELKLGTTSTVGVF